MRLETTKKKTPPLPCKWGNAQDELDLSCGRPAELVINCAPTFDPLSAEKGSFPNYNFL